MPANLSPEYKAAAERFRAARDPEERLEALREMLRVIPKHKGTDHLQADLKRRIHELDEELAGPRRGGARGGPPLVIRREGAAQLALLGAPNAGKSALHAALTHSRAAVAPYPFTTQYPEPGMLPVEDVALQLVDLPAVARSHPVPWLASTLQTADACLLVVDLADPADLESLPEVIAELDARGVRLHANWPGLPTGAAPEAAPEADVFRLALPTLLVGSKADLVADPAAELAALEDLTGLALPALAVSPRSGAGLAAVGPWLFAALGLVRVYTKAPGKPVDRQRPFTLRRGQTVGDVARLVHRGLAQELRYARLWDAAGHDGAHVGREHAVSDGCVLELHA